MSASLPQGPGIFFAAPEKERPDYLSGEIVAQNHPLTDGLNWNGLICKATAPISPEDGDEPLLWQGGRPLVFLRGAHAKRELVVNFDLHQSNADRLPAFIVLVNRFLETIRAEKVQFEQRNVETNQLLEVAGNPAGPPPRILKDDSPQPLRAPAAPGFFEVAQGARTLLAGAALFADDREGGISVMQRRSTRCRRNVRA